MNDDAPSYHGYRFPPLIISHAVWLYHRFCLSFRDAEDLLAQRVPTDREVGHGRTARKVIHGWFDCQRNIVWGAAEDTQRSIASAWSRNTPTR